VIVVGDSLLFGAGWYVEQGIAARGGQTVLDHGIIGWTSGQLRPVAEQAIDTVPADILVFEAGSNDVRDSLFYPDPAAALVMAGVERDAVLDYARAGGLCVVTVGVATRIDDRGLISFGPGWNAAGRSAVTVRDGVWVDWQAISADHPEWFVEDGLHHKAAGSAAFGDALAAGAARCAAGRPSAP
jgi:lysophospholipase L1-like esterase